MSNLKIGEKIKAKRRDRNLTQEEVANMLGISVANFKKQEPYLPFKRKYVGHGIRYRNTDIIRFILSDDTTVESNTSETK